MKAELGKLVVNKLTKEIFTIVDTKELHTASKADDAVVIQSVDTNYKTVKYMFHFDNEFEDADIKTIRDSLARDLIFPSGSFFIFREEKIYMSKFYRLLDLIQNSNDSFKILELVKNNPGWYKEKDGASYESDHESDHESSHKGQLTFDFTDFDVSRDECCPPESACSDCDTYTEIDNADDKIYISWDMIDEAMNKLELENPDLIICITRGGLIPAGLVSYKLNNKNIINIEVGSYNKEVQGELIIKKLPMYYLERIASSNKILIVDDIIDSGNTIKGVIDYICASNAHYNIGAIETMNRLEVFSILTKIDTLPVPQSSLIYSDSEQWIVFPWDK